MNNKAFKILIALYVVTIFVMVAFYLKRPVTVNYDVPLDVIKTVAHLNISNPELELMYSDSVNDIAYYRYVGERPTTAIGDIVYLYDGTPMTVVAKDITGLYLDDVDKIAIGMSGTIVTNSNGDTIGYVSKIMGDKVYCIWS